MSAPLLRSRILHTIQALLYVGAGSYILYIYLSYLRHTANALNPAYTNISGVAVKLAIFFSWLGSIGFLAIKSRAILQVRGFMTDRNGLMRAILATLLFSISVSGYYPPIMDLTYYFFILSVGFGFLLYGVFKLSAIRRLCKFAGRLVRWILALPSAFILAAASCFILALSYVLSGLFFQHFPWIDDTIVQLVHAKFLLKGHWYDYSHFFNNFFDMTMMVNDGKWYSQYPPGHIILLAAGLLFGHADLVNPVLGALTCFAIYLLAREVYGIYVARVAAILTALCSYLIIFSAEYMNNATSLLTGTLFLWAYFRVLKKPDWRYALFAGAMLGYCFITRPYSALYLALPAGIYGIYIMCKYPKRYLWPMLAMGAALASFVAFQLYYNQITTGNAFVYGYEKLNGATHNPFSARSVDRLNATMLFKKFCANLQRLNYFNRMLFEWPIPALSLVGFVFALRGHRRDERILYLTLVSMFLSLCFVTNNDFGWGPRLLYELNGILIVLCAKGLCMLPPFLRQFSGSNHKLSAYYGAALLTLCCFYVFAFSYNFQKPVIRDIYYLDGREGNPKYYKNIIKQVAAPALVFVPRDQYKYVSFTNPPEENSPVIFAIDLGAADQKLIDYYPSRHAYKAAPGSPVLEQLK